MTKIEVENGNNETIEVTSKEGIERACMQENKRKYLQIRHTPCLMEPLRLELGWDGNTVAGEQILQGTYQVPDGAHPYAQEVFNQIQHAEVIQEFATDTIDSGVFTDGWDKMKEKTSAGISGLHFGHL